MSFFSSWTKAIFIISLAFPLYSETTSLPSPDIREKPDCDTFSVCSGESDPICGTNGKTYYNMCHFCTQILKNPGTFRFQHYGDC